MKMPSNNKRVNKKKFRIVILLLFIFISVLFFLHFRFRPVIKSASLSRAKVLSNDAINEAILEELSENKDQYDEIIKMEKLENGELTVLFSDMQKVNRLKSRVALIVQNKFSEFKEKNIKIPLGTLSGFEVLSGLGPGIPMKISITGNVSTEFKSSFKDAGINQTIYQIYLYIHTKIAVMVPGCIASEDYDTNALISEIVILGGVPKVYSTNGISSLNTSNEGLD